MTFSNQKTWSIRLDTRRGDHTPKKVICPNCGKKKLVRYFNFETNEYLQNDEGRCDRQEKCGYHKKPTYSKNDVIFRPKKITVKEEFDILEKRLLYQQKGESQFSNSIINKFGTGAYWHVNTLYNLSAYNFKSNHSLDDAVMFWQIDKQNRIRTAKIMKYDQQLKRVKSGYSTDWLHSILMKEGKLNSNFHLKQCFFGEHLLNQDLNKTIAIVESAKTTLLGELWKPQYTWLSTEGLNGLTLDKAEALIGRKVILIPDFSEQSRELWKEKAKDIQLKYQVDIQLSNIGESLNDGSDLADLILSDKEIINSIKQRFGNDLMLHPKNIVGLYKPLFKSGYSYSFMDMQDILSGCNTGVYPVYPCMDKVMVSLIEWGCKEIINDNKIIF
ncbi:DUF6371 domain-containing protein [Flammeovirga pacifica]|uniref:Uncharacterized protein n=1 Tax=Flammeovirga pacifica TaxID=915059 RepID=A0A1S1YVS8_FLAPC|nr:DUF6371 domain-containing protein [Flammeovirga pacifica]OHX65129.1 hypothetical protein NH26_01545 [Flammeovirga pacifica]